MTTDIQVNLDMWMSLIERKIGMVLPERQELFFEKRIAHAISQSGLDEQQFYSKISKNEWSMSTFLDQVVINETRFFRDQQAMNFVGHELTEIQHHARVWSAGCSTGEEAWSVAILADSLCAQGYSIVGTDISRSAIEKAQTGQYVASKLQHVPEGLKQKYFGRTSDQIWRVSSDLMPHVAFFVHNLVDSKAYMFRDIDLIFCQNVLIYFRQFERKDVLNSFVKCLRIGGKLVLGIGESDWSHPDMRRVDYEGIQAYERIA